MHFCYEIYYFLLQWLITDGNLNKRDSTFNLKEKRESNKIFKDNKNKEVINENSKLKLIIKNNWYIIKI